MERVLDDTIVADNAAERARAWFTIQNAFINDVFQPRCVALGISARHVELLFIALFVNVGDIYRQTDISDERMQCILEQLLDRLLADVDRHKYYLSQSGADVGWDATINSIYSPDRLPKIQIDHEERAAYHDVLFPSAAGGDLQRVRTVIRLDAHVDAQEYAGHDIQVICICERDCMKDIFDESRMSCR